jgi:hypothetical protein
MSSIRHYKTRIVLYTFCSGGDECRDRKREFLTRLVLFGGGRGLRAALVLFWLTRVVPATGEVFEGKEDCHQRLQGWGLFEGFGVVQGRVWKDGTPRWEFRCKLHGTKTLNVRGLEPRKLEDKEGKVVTDR